MKYVLFLLFSIDVDVKQLANDHILTGVQLWADTFPNFSEEEIEM